MRRSFVLLLCLCSCSDIGLGVPGAGETLPAGGLPPPQTLEGGAQIRITQAGFQKLTSIVPGIVSDALSQGLCVAEQTTAGADLCFTNQGRCVRGCFIDLHLDAVEIAVTNANRLNVRIDASATGSVPIDPSEPFLSNCTLSLGVDPIVADAAIGLSIDPVTGAFVAELLQVNNAFDVSNATHSGCGAVSNLSSIVSELLDSLAAAWIIDAITPILNAGGGLVPAQTELAALVDLPALALTGLAASNGSTVETRVVSGGYAQFLTGGVSLGVVTGFNSDADPLTRAPGLASEPDPCVAGLTAPDLSAPPLALPISSRGTFVLPPADTFLADPEPANDVLIGVSRSALDLAGHHIVASGGMCLTVDADHAAFVRRDVLDDLLGIPLAAADAELRLVVRPQQPIHFTIGTGTDLSPHLVAALDDLEIDVESVPGGTPALRLSADIAIASQLGTRRDAGLPTRLETTRAALTVANPAVQVFDARYASVSATDLDVLAGTLADVVFSTLGADAGTVLVSPLGGFSLENIAVERVVTSEDDFLAVSASLGAQLPSSAASNPPAPTPQPLSIALVMPTPAELRAALLADDEAGLPAVQVALPTTDAARPLEHAWRTEGSAWRPYEATGDLVIRDRSFAWQGERTIELRSRVVGDDGTTSPTASFSVVIDWAPPAIFADQASFETHLVVPARDALSQTLEWAMGRVGEDEPATEWTFDPNLDAATALSLGDAIVVYVRDDAGNVTRSPSIQLVPEPGATLAAGIAGAALAGLKRRRSRSRR